jgi:hypothetical protein
VISFARDSWERQRFPFDDGTQEFDFDVEPSKLTIARCSIQPGAPTEILAEREADLIAWTIFQPPGHDVLGTDFGFYQGALYRVSGEPQRWTGASRSTSHDVVLLERWRG